MTTYLILAVLLIGAELIYFRIADHFNIIDKPNQRLSHSSIVLRGGGYLEFVNYSGATLAPFLGLLCIGVLVLWV